MFSLLMGFWHYLFDKTHVQVLIIGLDHAGKTVGRHNPPRFVAPSHALLLLPDAAGAILFPLRCARRENAYRHPYKRAVTSLRHADVARIAIFCLQMHDYKVVREYLPN